MATSTRGGSLKPRLRAAEIAAYRVPIAIDERSADRGFYSSYGKRMLDLLIAVPLAVVLAPLILVLAAAVVATSGWPAFYAAERVGQGGRVFRMWKIRTMRKDAESILEEWLQDPELGAEYRRSYKVARDSRITWIGCLLRKSSLDELPQLVNVIRGEMSLVGHRPVVEEELQLHYGEDASVLLSVRPGITGLWQVGGRNGVGYPTRSTVELAYVDSSSLAGDLSILVRTLLIPLRFNGR